MVDAQPEFGTFRIAVIGELTPKARYATSGAPPLRAFRADTVDQLLAQVALSLKLDVADPLGPMGSTIRVDLRIRELRDFRPDGIVEQVPALRALAQTRTLLPSLARKEPAAAQAALKQALPVPGWADALSGLVGAPEPRSSPAVEPTATTTPAAASIDDLLARVDVGGSAASSPQPSPAGNVGGLSSLIAQVARGGAPRGGGSAPGALSGRVDRAFGALLEAILEHPELRRLERSWRAVKMLMAECKTPVHLEVIFASDESLDAAFAHLLERSPDLVAPPDLIVLDHDLELSAAGVARLGAWADVGAQLRAPVVVTAAELPGEDEEPAAALGEAARQDWASWVTLAFNGGLVRGPHTPSSSRVQPPFAQTATSPSAHIFSPAAYLVARLCARSFAHSGWASDITGAEAGTLSGFETHAVSDTCAIAGEHLVGLDLARKHARRGLLVLACVPNRDTLACLSAPTLAAGAPGGGPTLSDQLFAARLAGVVEQLGDAIPSDVDPEAGRQAAVIAISELFPTNGPRVPDVAATIGEGRIVVTVSPKRFAGTQASELSLEAALRG